MENASGMKQGALIVIVDYFAIVSVTYPLCQDYMPCKQVNS